MSTRSKDKHLEILHQSPDLSILEIPGCKLPTYKQILICFLSHQSHDSTNQQKSLWSTAASVASKALIHYRKGNIPHLTLRRMTSKILEFIKKYKSINKYNKKRRAVTVKDFQVMLDRTMPLWPQDVVNVMENSK